MLVVLVGGGDGGVIGVDCIGGVVGVLGCGGVVGRIGVVVEVGVGFIGVGVCLIGVGLVMGLGVFCFFGGFIGLGCGFICGLGCGVGGGGIFVSEICIGCGFFLCLSLVIFCMLVRISMVSIISEGSVVSGLWKWKRMGRFIIIVCGW